MLIVKYFKALLGIYTVGILLLVILPINGKDQVFGHLNNTYIINIRLDYISHFLLFIPWVAIVYLTFGKEVAFFNFDTYTLISLLTFAIFAESIQYFLPYRTFNINDLLANVFGVLLGIILVKPIARYLTNFKNQENRAVEGK
ncbi:MAG: VanZ family protein [Psychroserpens sp.]